MNTSCINPATILTAILLTARAFAVQIETEIRAADMKVSASSVFSPAQDPVNLINGSGLSGDRHDNDGGAKSMWHTGENPAVSDIAGIRSPAWVRVDFAKPETFTHILIWNHNQSGLTNRGFRKTRIFGTVDGTRWVLMNEIELKQGGDAPQTIPSGTATPLRAVVIAADNNYGSPCFGLSEIWFVATRDVAEADLPFPDAMTCVPQPVFRHRADGKPGREISVSFTGSKLYGTATMTVECDGKDEATPIATESKGHATIPVLLPEGSSVTKACQAKFTLRAGGHTLVSTIMVPAQRQWTVYLYPHAHVDIGYTTTQEKVRNIHISNIKNGIALAEKTATYPEGARYKWNIEAAWALTSYLREATPEQRAKVVEAIRKGWLCLDGTYANINTSCASDEELLRLFDPGKAIGDLAGVPVKSMVQMDIPGASWGTVAAAAHNDIRYFLSFPNPLARIGWTREGQENRPFWWIGPDGKSRVLFLQAWPYSAGFQLKGLRWHMDLIHGHPEPIKTDDPTASFVNGKNNFLSSRLAELEARKDYPYDIFALSWCLCDNGPMDADLPDAVKDWNSKHAYPKLVIASASDIGEAYESRYGKIIPEKRGDFTECWTDGVGTDARLTAMNRHSKEQLVQAETLQAMLHPGNPLPAADCSEAWRFVLLGTEHTWSGWDPPSAEAKEISRVKTSYFETAKQMSDQLLEQTLTAMTAPEGKTIAVFNTLSWPRTGLVTLPKGVTSLKDIPTQTLSTGETVFLAKDVPALGVRCFQTDPSEPSDRTDLKTTATTIDNGIVKVTLDPRTGDISSLIRDGKEFAKDSVNSFRYLHGADAPAKAIAPTDVIISIKENGPVLASLLVESKADGCKWLKREIRLLAGQPKVEIINTLDKLAITNKEGVHFGFAFAIDDPVMRLDIPWGVMTPESDQLPGSNKNWLAVQRWADISNDRHGITWASPDAPLIEVGDMTANITAEDSYFTGNPHWRGPRPLETIPDAEASGSPWLRHLSPSATLFSWALNNHWNTNFPRSQAGLLTFRYGLLPHNTGYDAAAANRFGMEQGRPLVARQTKEPISITTPVTIDNPRVAISSLRSIPGGLAITLRSLSDQPESVVLSRPGQPGQPGIDLPPYGIIRCMLK